MIKSPRSRFFAALMAGILAIPLATLADTVKLKNGETLEGKITTDGADFIKLEIAVSATIKDTKIIPKTDIAEIIKAAPDDVALNDLRKNLPAPSLMSADAYRKLISTGPEKFLADFPNSAHKAEVEKILADLKEELDKVERGYVKVEGEWISPEEKKQYQALSESKIRAVVMKRKLSGGDYLGALRDFEILDERYFGTPAHVEAVPVMLELLPAFGQRLTRALQDVEYRNQKWEQDKGLLDEVARAQVEAARAQEVANFERAVEREKAAGVKWLSISDNSSDSLSGAIGMVKSELERLKAVDQNALKNLSEQLVAADKEIADGKLANAKQMVQEANALLAGGGAKPKKTSSKSKKSSNSSTDTPFTSYSDALYRKIAAAEEAQALLKEQQESAKKGDEASDVVAKSKSTKSDVDDPGEAVAADESKGDQASALTGLMGAQKKTEEEAADGGDKKPSSTEKSTPKKTSDDEEEEDDDRPAPVVADEEGGLNFTLIMGIFAGVMVLAIVIMKVLGIGGKKEEGGEA